MAEDTEESVSESSHDDESTESDHDPKQPSKDLGAEAAGFVRGLVRSLGRTLAQSPIGNLPKAIKPTTARQIARASDRISTGMSWYSAVDESSKATVSKPDPLFARTKAITFSIAKNSFLGTLVFETYCHTLALLAGKRPDLVENPMDEYDRATMPMHFGAGLTAGSVQGLVLSSPAMWNAIKTYRDASNISSLHIPTTHTPAYAARFVSLNTLNHSLAHSALFGSYEGTKRLLQQELLDDSDQKFGSGHLFCYATAGGLAGQAQHLMSHYTEQIFGLSEGTAMVAPSMIFRGFLAPTLRSTLMACPPSAIGFIAFEYGKTFG
jgi:hypothetical protein